MKVPALPPGHKGPPGMGFTVEFDEKPEGGHKLLSAYAALHFLAGLKRNDVLFGNEDPLAASWIAGPTGLSTFDFKYSEIAKLYSPFLCQDVYYRFENLLDDFFGFKLREVEILGDVFDYLLLRHSPLLPSKPGRVPLGLEQIVYTSQYTKSLTAAGIRTK